MKRLTHRQMASFLAYCETELAKSGLTVERRTTLEAKAAFYRQNLAGHCTHCGRPIEADESIATGLGSKCRAKQAVNA